MLRLKDALKETVQGWRTDIDPAWGGIADQVELGLDAVCSHLVIESWEPIFPSRRNKCLPGEPEGAHMFRAFDGISPTEVRCVLLGQDPYPCPAFSTGRAFEAGNTANWRELDKMFSKSVRALLLQIVEARTGHQDANEFSQWPDMLASIEAGRIQLEDPAQLANRWVNSGVLLLNTSLTLSRFSVAVDPHQSHGHLPFWRPLILAVLRHLAARDSALVIITLGDAASENVRLSGVSTRDGVSVIHRPHPAYADRFLACANPFDACNAFLQQAGSQPVDW